MPSTLAQLSIKEIEQKYADTAAVPAELGPCPVHRRSFDYIRELCGEYCDLYYDMKARGARVASRAEMVLWEAEVEGCAQRLSEMENRKLHLLSRLWKRIGTD